MIVTEYLLTREDGVRLVRTYSDRGVKILQNETGAVYDEAVDVESSAYTYSETEAPVGDEEISDGEALDILTGGAANEAGDGNAAASGD